MKTGIIKTIVGIIKKIVLSLVTEKLVKRVVVWGLEKLAESSKNKIDDEVVKIVKEALEKGE